jgi:hypothetical protein
VQSTKTVEREEKRKARDQQKSKFKKDERCELHEAKMCERVEKRMRKGRTARGSQIVISNKELMVVGTRQLKQFMIQLKLK